MAFNAAWLLSCLLFLALNWMSARTWARGVFDYALLPVTMLSVTTGILLLSVTRWKLAKQRWLVMKYLIAIAVMALTNVVLRPALKAGNDATITVTVVMMLMLLAAAAAISFRRPQGVKQRSKQQ